jgi:protein subunit release factor B
MSFGASLQFTKARLAARMARLGVRESDFVESFARSSGPGGQNVNKVSTAVTLRHVPSNLSVTAQDTRSQAMNRQLARERLLDAIEQRARERKQALKAAIAKRRRQNSPRPRGVKERMLDSKRRRGAVKKMRGKIES